MRQVIFAAALLGAQAAWAEMPPGTRQVVLHDGKAERRVIAEVSFAAPDAAGKQSYTLRLNADPFADHFLSMRPFQCLEGTDKHWCHVPYPYEINKEISGQDLTDLEYDLLFLWKGATDYGINMWNGVYYVLRLDQGRISGRLHEVDMGVLSAPPEAGNLRPLRPDDLHPADPDSHWLPYVLIE